MAIIIKLQDIDEAIENLRYKAETTLKSKLLRALRHYYQDEDSAESLESIDTEELVKTVWETGDDAALLKTKRKNFSSLKSSVNSDLKKLYAEGKNPLGIVIGHTNVFSISDEAKDKALSGIMDVFKDKGIDTQSKISEILSALSDILSSSAIDTEVENTKEEIERLKDVLGGISGKLGLSLQDIIRRGDDKGGRRGRTEEKTEKTLEDTEKVGDITDYLKGGLSMIDQALQGLAHEIEEASIVPSKKDMVDSVRTAIEDIVSVLKESKTDAAGEAQKIIVSAEKIIAGIAEDPATGLSSVQAEKIRQVLQEIAAAAEQGKLPEDGTATPAHKAGIELLAKVSDILGKAGMTADEKISKIMALVRLIADGALADAQVAASQEEQAQFIEKIDHIAQNIEELIRKSLHKAKTPESAEDVWRSSFSDISQALQDVETGTEDKAGKILEIVESTLDRMLEAPQSGLPDEQGEKLRQMIRQMTRTSAGPVDRIGPEDVGEEGKEAPEETVMTEKEEVRESLPGAAESVEGKGDAGTAVTEPAEAAEVKTGAKPEAEHQQLLQQAMQTTLADLLTAIQDSDTDAASKAKKIMAAVSELVGDALQKESGGEGGTDQERIREMLNKITDGLEALTELEVVEDLAGEGEMETIEIVEEVAPESLQEAAGIPVGEGGEYEIVEEIVGEGEGAGVGAEAEAGAGVGGEEGVSGAEGEGGEYEIVEEIVGEGEGAGVGAEGEAGSGVGGEEGVAGAEGEGGEYEIVEEIVGEGEGAGVGAEGEAGAGVGGGEGVAGAEGEGGEYEIVEEMFGE
nr:hypothetical protein [Syntrophaceae bacterium]